MNLSEQIIGKDAQKDPVQSAESTRNDRHSDFQRFIVLSRSRTGSNMLLSFLNSHPNIHAEGEVFNRLNGRSYREILSRVFADQPSRILAKGFKIFYYHPLDDDSCAIWQDLAALDNLRVIHLKRKNILRTLISRKIAGYHDIWVDKATDCNDNVDKRKAVSFSPKELRRGFEQTRQWEASGAQRFAGHPLLSVYYEDLARQPEAVFSKITDFLGVSYARPKTALKKQNPERLRDLLVNYRELKEAFSGTEWQEFFEE